MKREWKPGDVAMVRNEYDVWNRAICALDVERGPIWRYGVADAWMPMSADTRPLVVIDPENREQVERLRVLYHAQRQTASGQTATDDMQAALREFANPTPPKPEEPTGLGAVVEDAEGGQWVRMCRCGSGDDDMADWAQPHKALRSGYADIDVVRVLSVGVPA